MEAVSREIGVGVAMLERWRSAAARLEAVIATVTLEEAGKSAWCREHGVYPSELERWRHSAMAALADPEEVRASPQQTRQARGCIKQLEREVTRKDKALAETASLLVRFAEVPLARMVPMLADDGVYLASESSFHRVLRAEGQTAHRGRAKPPQSLRPPTTHVASGPNDVWCWDMTFLPMTPRTNRLRSCRNEPLVAWRSRGFSTGLLPAAACRR